MYNKLVVACLALGLLLGGLSISVCADDVSYPSAEITYYIIDSNMNSQTDIVNAVPDSFTNTISTRDYSSRNSIAAQGGYKYTWYSNEQRIGLTNVLPGYSSWYLSGRTDDDINAVAYDVAAMLDNNPYYGTPQRYELSSDGRVKVYTRNVAMSFSDINAKTSAAIEEIFSRVHNDYFSDTELANRYALELARMADYDMDCYNFIIENPSAENLPSDLALSMLPYGVLCNGKGVCGSYAQALMMLLRRSGIKAAVDSGIEPLSGRYHEWVIAELDGSWVSLDPTALEAGNSMYVNFAMPRDMSMYTFATSI